MSCVDLEPITAECMDYMPVQGKLTVLSQSGCAFNEDGILIGIADIPIENNKIIRMINLNEINSIKLSVSEYALILGKKTSSVTKNIRLGNSLTYVFRVDRKPNSRQYELSVSAHIKLKQPLK
jgi:hypothetical protein